MYLNITTVCGGPKVVADCFNTPDLYSEGTGFKSRLGTDYAD
jgi:hypothetical protein